MSNIPQPNQKQSLTNRPKNIYELIGLVKGLRSKHMNNVSSKMQPMPAGEKLQRQQILINVLLSFINSPELSLEVFKSGFDDALSDSIKESIGKLPPPPAMI
jgi:hypothetical protein